MREESREQVLLACWIEVRSSRALGIAVNVSGSGLGLRLTPGLAPGAVQPGDAVRLEVIPAAPEQRLVLQAKVVRVEPGLAGDCTLGLSLEGCTKAELAQWEGVRREAQQTLVVIDSDPDAEELYGALAGPFRLRRCTRVKEALEILGLEPVAVLICEEALRGMHCLDFLHRISQTFPALRTSRIVVSELTATGEVQHLVNRGQLFGLLRKPFRPEQVQQLALRAAQAYALARENDLLNAELQRANARLESENAFLRRRVVGVAGFERVLGKSQPLARTLDEVARLRPTDTSVHLWGETGTGKELLARALHAGGPRASGPFVVQSCTGLTESLLQSLLFGHKKGAFTGALRDHQGVFQRADGGTLFLDEVADLSPTVQAALLRALQEGEVWPLGGRQPVKVDVRLLSASQKDLRQETREGRFREDLYFRLVVVRVQVPPLRERAGDVPLLASHFLDTFCEAAGRHVNGFTAEAMRALEAYPWPGNVRELMNEVQRLVAVTPAGGRVQPEHLSPRLVRAAEEAPRGRGDGPTRVAIDVPLDEAVAELSRQLVHQALAACDGNVSQAAKRLGMERSRLAKLKARLPSPATPERGNGR